jgi:hypothetical protein
VLDSIYTICHRVAITEPILTEWQRHRSRFANRWLNQMFGRKKVVRLENPEEAGLEQSVATLPSPQRECAFKDIHLVAAAMSSDRIIVSCDERAREVFSSLVEPASLRQVSWANPERDTAAVLGWLARDAPPEAGFLLIVTDQ